MFYLEELKQRHIMQIQKTLKILKNFENWGCVVRRPRLIPPFKNTVFRYQGADPGLVLPAHSLCKLKNRVFIRGQRLNLSQFPLHIKNFILNLVCGD